MPNFEIIGNTYKRYRDGREVCLENTAGRLEYKARVTAMRLRQHGICCLFGKIKDCPGLMTESDATFEHARPRGAGGAWRDDRVLDENGEPMNGAAHGFCNGQKGSRRL